MSIFQKVVLLIVSCMCFLVTFVYADTYDDIHTIQQDTVVHQDIENNITSHGGKVKGLIGSIIDDIFDDTLKKIKNEFIAAFDALGISLSNNVLKWDGTKFVQGSISDDGSNISVIGSVTADDFFKRDGSSLGGKFVDGTPDATEAVYMDGNVGIGTTSPNRKLHISSPSSDDVAIRLQDDDANWFLSTTTEEGFGIYEGGTTTSNARLSFTTQGNVGIGTTTPSSKLEVNGKIKMNFQTQASDSNNTVATKGYVDSRVGIVPPKCDGENKALGFDGSNWICQNISSSGGDAILVNGFHTVSQCKLAGGTVVTKSGDKMCIFDNSGGIGYYTSTSCPAEWKQYKNWSKTYSQSCKKPLFPPCTTGEHSSFMNKKIETCKYKTIFGIMLTCTATVQEVGCY